MLRTTAILTALLFSGTLLAGEKGKVRSGLQKGQRCTPFQVVDVTGPNKGKQLCYV